MRKDAGWYRKSVGFFALLLFLAATACTGCGSEGSTAAEGAGELSSQGLAGRSKQFVVAGGDNTIQYFGHEGSRGEREEASEVVLAWDRARATRNWKEDCQHISKAYTDTVVTDAESTSKGKATNCVQALAFFGSVASSGSKITTTGPIDSLRISGDIAYAQYHGRHGVDWIVPLEKEAGGWKVVVTAPVNRMR